MTRFCHYRQRMYSCVLPDFLCGVHCYHFVLEASSLPHLLQGRPEVQNETANMGSWESPVTPKSDDKKNIDPDERCLSPSALPFEDKRRVVAANIMGKEAAFKYELVRTQSSVLKTMDEVIQNGVEETEAEHTVLRSIYSSYSKIESSYILRDSPGFLHACSESKKELLNTCKESIRNRRRLFQSADSIRSEETSPGTNLVEANEQTSADALAESATADTMPDVETICPTSIIYIRANGVTIHTGGSSNVPVNYSFPGVPNAGDESGHKLLSKLSKQRIAEADNPIFYPRVRKFIQQLTDFASPTVILLQPLGSLTKDRLLKDALTSLNLTIPIYRESAALVVSQLVENVGQPVLVLNDSHFHNFCCLDLYTSRRGGGQYQLTKTVYGAPKGPLQRRMSSHVKLALGKLKRQVSLKSTLLAITLPRSPNDKDRYTKWILQYFPMAQVLHAHEEDVTFEALQLASGGEGS